MPEWYLIAAALVAFAGGVFGMVNGYRAMKKSSPFEEMKKEITDKWKAFYNDKWDKVIERLEAVEEAVKHVDSDRTKRKFEDIDEKLDNDHARIKMINVSVRSQQRFLVLLLKSQQQILAHLAEGNHTGALQDIEKEIQELLLHEATRVDRYEHGG